MFNVRAFDSAQEIVASSERQIAKRQCTIYKELQQNVQVFNTIHPIKLNGYTYNRNVQELNNVCDISCGKVSYASSYEMLADVRQGAQLIYPDACCECINLSVSYLYAVGLYTNQPLRIYNADGTRGSSLVNSGVYDTYVAKYTPSGDVLWAAHISGTAYDLGTSITTDNNNKVYVCGYYNSNPIQIYNADGQLSDLSLNNLGGYDVFIVKYSAFGTASWAAHIGGTLNDNGNNITTDQSNNVYVDGYYNSNPLRIYNAGSSVMDLSLNNQGSNDAFLVKYNSSGIALWATHIGGTLSDAAYHSVVTDTQNNVYIGGSYRSNPLRIYNADGQLSDFSFNSLGSLDGFLVKYNSLGYALWATHLSGSGVDATFSVQTDSLDNVYAVGYYNSNPLRIYNAGSLVMDLSLNNTGDYDTFVVKYTPLGVASWATHIGGTGGDFCSACTIDPSNNLYVTGYYDSDPLRIYNANGQLSDLSLNNTAGGYYDTFIVKYDSNGFALWAAHIGGTLSDNGYSIKADPDGNVYVCGSYDSPYLSIYNSDGQLSPLHLTNTGAAVNSFIVKYDSAGTALWASKTGDIGISSCEGLAIASA